MAALSLLFGGSLALALPRRANAQLLVQRELLLPLLLERLSYERVRGQAGRILLRHVVHHLPGGGGRSVTDVLNLTLTLNAR